MNLVFVDDATAFGGHELMAVAAAAAVSRQRPAWHVTFVVWEGNQRLIEALRHKQSQPGGRLDMVLTSHHAHRAQGIRSLLFRDGAKELRRVLATLRPDLLVAVQGRIELGVAAVQAAKDLGVRVASYLPMAHTHVEMGTADPLGLKDRVAAHLYALPQVYITVNQAIARQIATLAPGKGIKIVENFASKEPGPDFDKHSARQLLQLPTGKKLVGVIGRIQFSQKGHDILLKALAQSSATFHNTVFLIVGDGPDYTAMQEMVGADKLESHFIFMGWQSKNMPQIFQSLDLLLVPSIFESGPLVLLEALLHNVPVVCSTGAALSDMLPPDLCFPPADVRAMITAVNKVLGSDRDQAYLDAAYTRARAQVTSEASFGANFASALDEISSRI